MLVTESKLLPRYKKLCGEIREVARSIKQFDAKDPYRIEKSALFLDKLHQMGLIPSRWDLSLAEKVTASCFCRRRLPIIMVKSK